MKDHPFDSSRRRAFLKTGLATALVTAAGANSRAASWFAPGGRSLISTNDTVLFQGDSITDMGRSRDTAATPNNASALGNGYASLAGLELLADRPDDGLRVFNRGVSGNKVYQL